MWIAALALIHATSLFPPWYETTPADMLREAPRSVEARRDRSLHQARVLVRGRGDRHARRFLRARRQDVRRCANLTLEVWWGMRGMFHPVAMVHEHVSILSGFEVSFAGDGSVSVEASEQGYHPIPEACIVDALAGHERAGKLSLVVFGQGARSYRDESRDDRWNTVWSALEALDRGADKLQEAEELRRDVEAFRADPPDWEAYSVRRQLFRYERDLCETQVAALGFFGVAKELDRRPELEVYLGQAHERLGDSRRAAKAYARYVRGRSDAVDADEFRQRIARLQDKPNDSYRPVLYGPTKNSDPLAVECDWIETPAPPAGGDTAAVRVAPRRARPGSSA